MKCLLTTKEIITLKNNVDEIIQNHKLNGYILNKIYFDKKSLWQDYYQLCLTWHFYIHELIILENYELCAKIRKIIIEEKEEALSNAVLSNILDEDLDVELDIVEDTAREEYTNV